MPTKNTKSPAESQATSNVPTVVAESMNKRKPAPVIPESTDMIVDAVADLLAHGGSSDDVDALIHAAMGHKARRELRSGLFRDEPSEIGKRVKAFIEDNFNVWKGDLCIIWRNNKRESAPALEPKTVSDLLRWNVRDDLESRFQTFLRDATPEEVRLMESILCTWDSGIYNQIEGVDEFALGEAFAHELGRGETYLRLPRGYKETVQKYVDALKAIEDKVVA